MMIILIVDPFVFKRDLMRERERESNLTNILLNISNEAY